MFLKLNTLEQLIKDKIRYFKVKIFAGQLHNYIQYTSGGDDYCPLNNSEALGGMINNNPAHGFVIGWRDVTDKKAAPGEKRIFAVDADNKPVAEIHLKNDGKIAVMGSGLIFEVSGDASVKANALTANIAATATITAATVNLGGEGGAFVLTENSTIKDSQGGDCVITSNTSKTKAV